MRTPSMGTPVALSGGTTETIRHERPNGDDDEDVAEAASEDAAALEVAGGPFSGALVTICLPKIGAQLAT